MSLPSDQDPFVGCLLAEKYQIVKRIGQGGMGAVYLALHVLMERRVAVKIVPAGLADIEPVRLSRFHLEAKAASCLNHPNIISVFDFGITRSGVAYLVMDYIEGEGLDQVMRRERRMPPLFAARIFTQVCDGLAHAHERGIVHRDLKPSNIMISKQDDGTDLVHIVDFGIAKFMAGTARPRTYSARDSQIVGSPLYMSPEQCQSDAKLDGRSDIYSVGCLLYHALAGRPPFTETSLVGLVYSHLNERPKPLSELSPAVKLPESLDRIVMKALKKKQDERQQTMKELKFELQAVEAGLKRATEAPDAVANARQLMRKLTDIEAGKIDGRTTIS
jgi:serine/threonine protein kinase